MQFRKLGRTGLDVSAFCLGTMTYSTQTPEDDAHAQIDMFLDHGGNFVDTAELYPVNPMKAELSGNSEIVIGNWLARTGRRGDMVLATKVSGEGNPAVRNGEPITGAAILGAVEGSLKRLQTEYIDLYQLHWPNRGSYHFRKCWTYDPTGQNRAETLDHMAEVLGVLDDLVRAGKVRHVGLSNESAWGTAQFLRIAEQNNLPRVASVQNEYSLMCRLFDTDMAELSHNEDVGLLAFSPLATGMLTGKYHGDVIPVPSRRTFRADLGGRMNPTSLAAADAYVDVARKHGLDPVHMALAFCTGRPFMASVIFGATRLAQLQHLLNGADLVLSDAVLSDIDTVHRQFPQPF